jgi:hypothetical protein
MNRVYEVTYNGSWLGGKAIVIAHNAHEARRMVNLHEDTVNFRDVQVRCLCHVVEQGVVYHDNGDY